MLLVVKFLVLSILFKFCFEKNLARSDFSVGKTKRDVLTLLKLIFRSVS